MKLLEEPNGAVEDLFRGNVGQMRSLAAVCRLRWLVARPSGLGDTAGAVARASVDDRAAPSVAQRAAEPIVAASVDAPTVMVTNNVMRVSILAVALVVLGVPPAWCGYDEGKAAADRDDWATALNEWRRGSEAGDAASQTGLGWLGQSGSNTDFHGGAADVKAHVYNSARRRHDTTSRRPCQPRRHFHPLEPWSSRRSD